jgi:TRAP transporter 4TM/12TM fusion protein
MEACTSMELKHVEGLKYRTLEGAWQWITLIFITGGLLITISYAFQFSIAGNIIIEQAFHAWLLAIFLPLAFIWYPATRHAQRHRPPWYDIIAAILGFVAPFSIVPNALDILLEGQMWNPSPVYIVAGTITWVLLIMASIRAIGLPFTVIVSLISVYPAISHLMPGFLVGIKIPLYKLVSYHFLSAESMFGIPLAVTAKMVISFIVFAAALEATGGGTFFINLALSIFGHVRGGAAKVSIVSSALFASVSGSAAANVLSTGSFTIPAMKRTGYEAHYAAAVEACASTGGVLTPPVMGVVAFVMAEFLGVPYLTVIITAAVPMLMYYLGLFVQVDAYAVRMGIRGLPENEKLPSFWRTLQGGWFYIIAFIVLVFLIALMGLEHRAAWYATALLLVLSMGKKSTRITLHGFLKLIENAGRMVMEITIITASAGLIIGAFTITGLGLTLPSEILSLTGGNIYAILIFGAITSFILGMGMSATACYIFLALVMVPGLVQAGLLALSVHFFVLYWGMISFITPPFCLAAYVAASIAGTNPMKTGFKAMKLGVVIYFIPFFFVLEPALILQGPVLTILWVIPCCIVGVVLVSAGLGGYLIGLGKVNCWVRILLIILGSMIALPEFNTTFLGLGISATIALILWLKKYFKLKETTKRFRLEQKL